MQDVIFSENGRTLTATPTCEIDHHTAKFIREKIDKALFRTGAEILVLDFSEVRFMDSSGIGLVMGRYRNLQKLNAQLHITGTSPQITKVMRLAGIERLAKLDVGGFKVENYK